VVLECIVYRHMAHSAPIFDDKACYREVDTLEERLKQCPIARLRGTLINEHGVSAAALESLEASITEACRKTISDACASSYPEVGELYTDVYAK
jgi:TPP-dependent pyruvate/acetoin dehydrogenase alpha subunit